MKKLHLVQLSSSFSPKQWTKEDSNSQDQFIATVTETNDGISF